MCSLFSHASAGDGPSAALTTPASAGAAKTRRTGGCRKRRNRRYGSDCDIIDNDLFHVACAAAFMREAGIYRMVKSVSGRSALIDTLSIMIFSDSANSGTKVSMTNGIITLSTRR
jgi:hypothetical protein